MGAAFARTTNLQMNVYRCYDRTVKLCVWEFQPAISLPEVIDKVPGAGMIRSSP
jgi:hypothetical protein